MSPAPDLLPPRRRPWGWLVGAVVLLAAALGWWRWQSGSASQAALPKIDTAQVDRGAIVARVNATGTLSALVTVQVGSQVSGRIAEVKVDYNSLVREGDVLVRLDPKLFEAAVANARANRSAARGDLLRAKALADDARRTLQRLRGMLAAGASSGAEVDSATANLAAAQGAVVAAQGRLEQAQAQLQSAELNLSYTTIRSPISGIVISKTADVGQTVAASLQSPNLVQIAQDLSKMQVDTNVGEADIGKLRDGMAATFRVDAWPGELFSAKVRQVRNAPQLLQNVVTYDAVLDVDNPQGKLKPGMTANVTFEVERRQEAVRVPNLALRFKPSAELLASLPVEASDTRASSPAAPSGGRGGGRAGMGRERPGGERAASANGEAAPRDVRNVWLLQNGKPRPVKVKLGLTDGAMTEVLWGLRPGDAVITDVAAPAAKSGAIPGLTGPSGPPGGRRGGM